MMPPWKKSRHVLPRPLEHEAIHGRYIAVRRWLRLASDCLHKAKLYDADNLPHLASEMRALACSSLVSAQHARAWARLGRREMWGAASVDVRELLS